MQESPGARLPSLQSPQTGPFYLGFDSEDSTLDDLAAVVAFIQKAKGIGAGKLSLAADAGARPWWHRLFGASRWVRLYFTLWWVDNHAWLLFFDEDASEFRVRTDRDLSDLSEPSVLDRFSADRDDLERIPVIPMVRAFEAIELFLDSAEPPDWLRYDYVR